MSSFDEMERELQAQWGPVSAARADHKSKYDNVLGVALGRVIFFNRQSFQGRVRVGYGEHPFDSTAFSSSPGRWPIVGEPVEVVFGRNYSVLAVRAKPRDR